MHMRQKRGGQAVRLWASTVDESSRNEISMHYRRILRDDGVLPLPGAVPWVKRLSESGWLQALSNGTSTTSP